jgi:hypothetical protein
MSRAGRDGGDKMRLVTWRWKFREKNKCLNKGHDRSWIIGIPYQAAIRKIQGSGIQDRCNSPSSGEKKEEGGLKKTVERSVHFDGNKKSNVHWANSLCNMPTLTFYIRF